MRFQLHDRARGVVQNRSRGCERDPAPKAAPANAAAEMSAATDELTTVCCKASRGRSAQQEDGRERRGVDGTVVAGPVYGIS
jgi:hypothetical protein